LFYLLLASPTWAQELDVKLGIMKQAPYGFLAEGGVPSGYLFEISEQVSKRTGFRDEIRLVPMKRLHVELMRGSIDCSFFARTKYVDDRYIPVEPIGKMLVAGVLPRADVKIAKFNDLAGLNIGVPLGVYVTPEFESAPDINRIQTLDYPNSVKLLDRRRLDGIVGAIDSLRFNMKKLGVPPSKVGAPYAFIKLPIWLVCNKTDINPKITEKLGDAVKNLREEGVIAAIIKKYLGEP
jgi:polar amino acid transport system substrate-binding protein